MNTPLRPNFFLLLELNPEQEWDEEYYKKTLQEKIRQWNRDSTSIAKKALAAQSHQTLLPQIHEVMENKDLREQEAQDARAIIVRLHHAALERFERQLYLLNLQEQAESTEIEHFIDKFKNVVSPEEIRNLITVKIQTPDEQETRSARPLDSSISKNISDRLEILNMTTLYDLLECEPESAIETLFQAAEKLYQQEVRQRPTATTTTRLELAGFAMSLFKTDEIRARYDESLRRASLLRLLQDLEESLQLNANKELHPRQVLYFLKKAAEAGWQEKKAIEQLKAYGRRHQWTIVIPFVLKPKPKKRQSRTDAFHRTGQVRLLQPLSTAENIAELQYQILYSSIRLYWKWPDNCPAVYLSYSTSQTAIEHHASEVSTLYIEKDDYDRLGYHEIDAQLDQSYHILISSITEQDGIQHISDGIQLHIHPHKIVFTYEIHLLQRIQPRRTLSIHSSISGPVPSLILISKLHNMPTHKQDGSFFHRIEGHTDSNGDLTINLPDTPLATPSFGKLFLEDDRLSETILLRHPSQKYLRLN